MSARSKVSARSCAAIVRRRACRWAGSPPDDRSSTSTRPAASRSAGRTATAGLTGRKIIVDTYGGAAPHGGGAFSGKDPTKVDRSAAYVARYLAKNVVAAGLAERCTIQLSYAIGVSKPLSLYVDLHGTGQRRRGEARGRCSQRGHGPDARAASARTLASTARSTQRTAAYGHFGRQPDNDGGFSWERLDLVEPIRAELS